MIGFFAENFGTIAVALAVAGVTAAAVIKILRDKKKGKCPGCSGGCSGYIDCGGCAGNSPHGTE